MKILRFSLFVVAIFLMIRVGQIHREVAKAAAARKSLLGHFVDHTVVLTKRQMEEQQFGSNYGEHSERAFHWNFLGGLAAFAVASLPEKHGLRAGHIGEARG